MMTQTRMPSRLGSISSDPISSGCVRERENEWESLLSLARSGSLNSPRARPRSFPGLPAPPTLAVRRAPLLSPVSRAETHRLAACYEDHDLV